MPLLDPSEYDISYFDGYLSETPHPAGYTHYQEWHRRHNQFVNFQDSTGEYFADIAKFYRIQQFLDGKTILELGSAKGYIVKWLRDQGISAWGIEVSPYAWGLIDPTIQPYVYNANVMTKMFDFGHNDFNVIYSRFFLECLSDSELVTLIPQLNNVGFLQIHHLCTYADPNYYNIKPVEDWLALPFKNKTVFIVDDDVQNPYFV